jgi:hypothetical protein
MLPDGSILYCSDSSGIYIPQRFVVETYPDCIQGLSDSDRAILEAGPDHQGYWHAWDDCLTRVVVQSREGDRYTLWQDGDLWLIPEGAEWADEG